MKSQIARSNEYSFCHLSKIHKDFPKFNISKSNSNFFKGLPTPANTILIYSIAVIVSESNRFADLFLNYSYMVC